MGRLVRGVAHRGTQTLVERLECVILRAGERREVVERAPVLSPETGIVGISVDGIGKRPAGLDEGTVLVAETLPEGAERGIYSLPVRAVSGHFSTE